MSSPPGIPSGVSHSAPNASAATSARAASAAPLKSGLRNGVDALGRRHAFGALLAASRINGKLEARPAAPVNGRANQAATTPSSHSSTAAAKASRNAYERNNEERPDGSGFDPLDPATRRAAQLAPPVVVAPGPIPALTQQADVEVAPRARVSMEELLPQLVKRIAWAGDRTRGSVQMELGAGPHAGTTVTVHSESGRVRVELQGAGVEELRTRIEARLKRSGIDVESVT